jgi:hypothetical protein
MTAEEKQAILKQSRETIARVDKMKLRTEVDPPPPPRPDRVKQWRDWHDERDAEREQAKRAMRREREAATEQHTTDWAAWTHEQIEARAAVLTDATGQFVGQVREELREEFEGKVAELKRELERERASHQRELERQAAESRRERDMLQKTMEMLQTAHTRELTTVAKGLTSIEQRVENVAEDLFGASAESVWDALGEAWRRHHQRRSNNKSTTGEIIELPAFLKRTRTN